MLQIFETGQFLRDGFELVFIENQVSGLFHLCKRFGQAAQLVLGQVKTLAAQDSDIVRKLLEAIARQKDVLDFRQTTDIPSFQVQFVEIQVDFLKAIQRSEPSGNVFDLITFQVQSFQMLATLDARRTPIETGVSQREYLDFVVFWDVKIVYFGPDDFKPSHRIRNISHILIFSRLGHA